MSDDCFCVGCNCEIEENAKTVQVRVGKLLKSQVVEGKRQPGRPRGSDDRFKPETTWGLLHLACFSRAIETPSLPLNTDFHF